MRLVLLFWLLTRYYWPVSVTTMAHGNNKHTHVQVLGAVDYMRLEDDGDLHIRLRSLTMGDTSFIVAECIPKLPCRRPRIGEIVTVRGISRFDPEHGWYEVHPVEEGP